MEHGRDLTALLGAWTRGEDDALERLAPLVYDRLHDIARRQMAGEDTGHTLRPTALVHETFMELARLDRIQWEDRTHFFALSARLMRRLLVDHAVHRKAEKRGGGRARVPLDDVVLATVPDPDEILALEEALTRLEESSRRQCRVVECRVFAGMTVRETAEALDVSPATVKRDWTMARARLNRALAS